MNIREYLCKQGRSITDAAPLGARSAEAWLRERPARRKQFFEMMSLPGFSWDRERPPVPREVTGVLEREGYRVEKICFESLPRLYVAGNLYLPANPEGDRLPAVLYLCGHAGEQKVYYQAHARRFAELGFVCLIIDTIQYGEVFGYHGGTYAHGWWDWYSRGYTPAGVELYNAIRAVDLLQSLPTVDGTRVGVTGNSGGGSVSWWLSAGDDRIGCLAPSCCTGTVASHLADRTIDGHCDCVLHLNTYGWDLIDVSALSAPRPCLIASADEDVLFTIESVREHYERLKRIYTMLGKPENLGLIEVRGKHGYDPPSRKAIFSFFLKHLADREVPPEEIEDIDPGRDEPAEHLRVFVNGIPANDASTTIQDDFIPRVVPPAISTAGDLEEYRVYVLRNLREKTFRSFPDPAPGLDLVIESRWDNGLRRGHRFSIRSEEDRRLFGMLAVPTEARTPAPVMVVPMMRVMASRTDTEFEGLSLEWARVQVEPVGGRETGWHPDLSWWVRRSAALTGRTVASMRVWDLLRTLEAVRGFPEVDPQRIALAGSGEMAAVVLYAAALDGNILTVILHDPLPSQDIPGAPDGNSPHLEMLNCLRFTDLPQMAALAMPADLVFLGPRPDSYRWAEEVYARLGGRCYHVRDLKEYNGLSGIR